MSVPELEGIDEDEAQCPDGTFVFGVSFEQFGGVFDFLVIAGERVLDELNDLFCCETVEINV